MTNETDNIFSKIPSNIGDILKKQGILEFRPSQIKSIEKGLFSNTNNQIVCTPTGSGKTLVAELGMLDVILNKKKKVLYVVPLKALASEKYREFSETYGSEFTVKISVGDATDERFTNDFDVLMLTSEKLDSMIRHSRDFLDDVGLVIADEVHLINDESRGATLEVLLSIFKAKYPSIRIIGLSATIGNAEEICSWLEADLVFDEWRPVELHHLVLSGDELSRYK
jgi:helicase